MFIDFLSFKAMFLLPQREEYIKLFTTNHSNPFFAKGQAVF